MDYKNVFIGLLVAFVVVTAVSLFAVDLNNKYAGQNITALDTGFMQDSGLSGVEGYASGVSTDVANSTAPPSVSGSGDLTQSKNTFSLLRSLVDFIPNLFDSVGSIFGIPEVFIKVAKWAFIFAFGITLAYILILGVKNFL